jgi:hypothetical protein
MNSGIVWSAFIVIAVTLGFIGYWFSLRTLRWCSAVAAVGIVVGITCYGSGHPAHASADLGGSFLRGGDAVIIALLRPLWGSQLAPPLSDASRWIIAVVLLLGYRGLETWTLHWQAPQLDLSMLGQAQPAMTPENPPGPVSGRRARAAADSLAAAQLHDELAAELRFRLPAMEIRSPAILPGGRRTGALASIVQSSGVSGAGLASAVIQLASLLWPTPARVRARVWTESAPLAPGPRVTVLLDDARNGQTVSTKTVVGSSLQESASMVAGYIARQIFAMDRTVADWCYGTADGRDLAAMQLARMERVNATCPDDLPRSREQQLAILRKGAGTVRAAGVARYELAQLCALTKDHLEALRLHALNRELHPRLYRGRYRLAMTLEMIASPEHPMHKDRDTPEKLQEILDTLNRCEPGEDERARYEPGRKKLSRGERGKDKRPAVNVKAADSAAAAEKVTPEPPNFLVSTKLCEELLDVAAEELREVRKQLTLRPVVRDAIFRRSERPVWLPHWRQLHRETFHDGVCVAELFIHVRKNMLADPAGAPAWLDGQGKVQQHLRKAVRIASSIAGDKDHLNTLLTHPLDQWPDLEPDEVKDPRPAGDRARWLSRRRHAASWQAAYNTACLYAALAGAAAARAARAEAAKSPATGQAQALEVWVIDSLRRAIDNPQTELDHPSTWIRYDPDFSLLRRQADRGKLFEAFGLFVRDQEVFDYPYADHCPLHPRDGSGTAAVSRRQRDAPPGRGGRPPARERPSTRKAPDPTAPLLPAGDHS